MKTLNCIGMLCPMPIVELAKAIADVEVGDSLTLLADDPATEADLSAWSRMTGNQIKVIRATEFLVVKTKMN